MSDAMRQDAPERRLGTIERAFQMARSGQFARLDDLRRALNALEVLVLGLPEGGEITAAELEVFARERRIRYDADEDEHYDTISAFIKSCRGSDPDAAERRARKTAPPAHASGVSTPRHLSPACTGASYRARRAEFDSPGLLGHHPPS